jgi:hypothetical protein
MEIEKNEKEEEIWNELQRLFSEMEIKDDDDDDDIEELTKGIDNLNLGPIKVVIMPFAHGGVIPITPKIKSKKWLEGLDVQLITSTSGTCTLMKNDSYLKLFATLVSRVKYSDHTKNTNFDRQLVDYFNNFQNQTVLDTIFYKKPYPQVIRTELNEEKVRIESNQTKEGYIDIISNTYKMYNLTDVSTDTKIYGPIPENDPLWDFINPITNIMGVNAIDYSEKPLAIYMYVDNKGVFRRGIIPDTYSGITLHEILHITNEHIKSESKRKFHYVFADPNCSYKPSLTAGGKVSKQKYKKKSRKIKTNNIKKNRKQKGTKRRSRKIIKK